MKFWQRLQHNRPEQIERNIEDELRFHLAMRTQQNRAAGMSAEEAQADALARFGNYEAVKAQCRAITKEKLARSLPRSILNALMMNNFLRRDEMKMTLGILSIFVGLAFMFPALIEVNSYWGDPLGMTVSFTGILYSLLLIVTGGAILRKRRYAKVLVMAAAGSGLIFTSIGGSLHFLGKPSLLLGTVFPVILLIGYLREPGKQAIE